MSAAASPEAAGRAQQHPEAGKSEAISNSAPLAREIKAPSQTPRPPRAARTSKETISLQGKIGNTEMTEIQVNLRAWLVFCLLFSVFQVDSIAKSVCHVSGKVDAN